MSREIAGLRDALESGPDRDDCPEPALFLRAAEGALAPGEVQALLDHAAACGVCALSLRLAREVAEGGREGAERVGAEREKAEREDPAREGLAREGAARGGADGARPDPSRAQPQAPDSGAVIALRPRRWRVLAAGLAAAAALAVVPTLLHRGPPDELRGAAASAIRAALPAGRLPRAQFVLRWTPLANARYDVTVATRDLRVLHSAHALETPEVHVPQAALAGLQAGEPVIFLVVAVLPDGSRVTSGALRAEVE